MLEGKRKYYESHPVKPAVAGWYWSLVHPATEVLDLGCGNGELGAAAPDGVRVAGVDHDPGAVELARRFEDAHQVDLEEDLLPFPDGHFDAVIARDVFEHLHNAGQALTEARRVLRPRGVLVASVVSERPRRVWADYTHVRGYTEHALRLFLEDTGFAVAATWPMGGVPLTSRFEQIHRLPVALRFPPLNALFASSWEAKALKLD